MTRTDGPTRCAVYLRISQDRDGDGLAVERQREDCLRLARERGWQVVEVYEDTCSASKRNVRRPAYDRMVADYRAGRFGALVCWDLDRLTRQPAQLEQWIEAAEERGLVIVTANGEADLGTDNGRLFARIKAAVSKGEIERKAERQRRAAQQRAEKGRVPAGVRPMGYSVKGDVEPEEADVVRECFRRFAAGDTLRGLVRYLDSTGIRPRRGSRWVPSTVHDLLSNPRYAGRQVYKGEVLEGVTPEWTPLVTPDLFDLVQHRLRDPRRVTNRQGTDRRWFGSGLYRCTCRKRMTGWSGQRYRCVDGCYSRSGRQVDEYVLGVIEHTLSLPDLADLLASSEGNERASDLLAEANRLRVRLATVEADYDAGLIDGRRYAVATEKVRAELDRVEAERTRLLAGFGPSLVLAADDPAEEFRKAPLGVQRAVVDYLAEITLTKVGRSHVLDPDSIVIRWKHGGEQAVADAA